MAFEVADRGVLGEFGVIGSGFSFLASADIRLHAAHAYRRSSGR